MLFSQAYGQDINCPVTESWMKAKSQKQRGKTALTKKNASTEAITGPQDLVILFVDYPEGRIQPGNILPTTDADTMYFHNIGNDTVFDAIGGMGTVHINPDDPNSPMRKKIRKYTYDDYWDMYFSVGTYYGSAHPDSASHGILAYGSFRDYYREVSYGKIDIVPYQTKPGTPDKYSTGIINPIDEANGKKYIRWIMMPKSKSSYTYNGEIKTPYLHDDIDPVLRDLYNQGQINFDVDTYQGKMIIVGAGQCSGGISDGDRYSSVREKRYYNYDTRSTLDGIWVSVHEYGHTLQFSHLASSTYDPMNATIRNEWTRHLYCPPHFNPIYKLQTGWISPSSVSKIRSDSSISLSPINTSPSVAAYTVYGDALKNNDYTHSEYFIAEYRKREGFNRFSGGQDSTSFTGGVLIWHYSSYNGFTFGSDNQESNIGLKIAGYCDADNHSDFITNTGDPLHFYYGDRNLINASTSPNTSSLEHLTTGIAFSNFSDANNQITITAGYTLGVPTYTYFGPGDAIPSSISGNVYIDNGAIAASSTTIDNGATVIIAPNATLFLNSIISVAQSQSGIVLRGIGYDSNHAQWSKFLINGNETINIQKNLISDLTNGISIDISANMQSQPILTDNIFTNCGTPVIEFSSGPIAGSPVFPTPSDVSFPDASNTNYGSLKISRGCWKVPNGQNITIPVSSSWTISTFYNSSRKDPLTQIKMGTNSNIIVNGKLTVTGTRESNVVFTSSGNTPGSWGSIVFNGGGTSGSVLDRLTMQYGTNIQVLNSASNITIKNSVIDNNKGAIFFNNSSGSVLNNHIFYTGDYPGINIQSGSFVTCSMNNIKKINGDYLNVGICFSGGANGTLWQNDIGYFNWGVGAIWGSSPAFWNQNYNGDNRNNRVTNCQYGVMVYQNSYPQIGDYDLPPFGVSTIENNEVDIALNTNYSTVSNLNAANIYWNNGNPIYARFMTGIGSTIRTSPYSATDYWSNIPLLTVQTSGNVKGQIKASKQPTVTSYQLTTHENAVSDDSLFDGINLRLGGKFKEAKDYFVSYLGKHPDNQQTYVELYNCYSNETAYEITKYFENLPKAALKEQELLLSYLYLKQGNMKAAKEVNNRIISKYTKTPIETMAKLGNFYIALYNENDPQAGSMILNEVLGDYYLSTSVELELAQTALMTYVDPKTGSIPYANYRRDSVSMTPTQIGLLGNYPNPFNSTTVIAYQLSVITRVIMKVYDILGREVTTLVDEIKGGGRHTVIFDGSKLSSGVYFVRFIMKPQDGKQVVQVKKMCLIK
jgi:M6 family metalloprotease-like protein